MVMDVVAAAARLEAQGRRIIHMEVGQPAAGAPAAAIAAARDALGTARLGYTETLGTESLRRRIALAYGEWHGIDLDPARVVVTTGSSAAFMLAFLTLLAAQEFWRGRGEPLMSRWPTVIVLIAHALILLVRVPAVLLSATFRGEFVLSTPSFTLLAFGTLLFTVVLAFLQLNMTKERTELKHKINSLVDPLSGVANRRAFLDRAAGLLVRQETDHEPLAMLLFDLDHFKQINDQFGHAIGDTVLQSFAATATQTLGADILFARIGGEEFASCLPVGDLDEAYAIADRVRRNFAAAAAPFGSASLSPSVSVGVTVGCDPGVTVTELLSIVDRALYRAKELGRNRVELGAPAEAEANFATPSIVPIIGPDRAASAPQSAGRRWRVAS